MNQSDHQKLTEISRLLDEAYKHYFEYEGHCKSSEGFISVEYGNYFERADNPTELDIKGVYIYSYVFCKDGRSQDFSSIDEALETVREWHREEMSYDYQSEEAVEDRRLATEMAINFLNTMEKEGRLTVINIDDLEEELDESDL